MKRTRFGVIVTTAIIITMMTQTVWAADVTNGKDYQKNSFEKIKQEYLQNTELSEKECAVLDKELSAESVAFLSEHEVKIDSSNEKLYSGIKKLCAEVPGLNGLNEDILSLKEDTAVYNFDNEQISKYIEGIVTTEPIIIKPKESSTGLAKTVVQGPVSSGRHLDDAGGGYEVQSKPGYFKSTSYATLPTFSNYCDYTYEGSYEHRSNRTAGYMMFTVGSSGQEKIDIGLSYSKGNTSTDTPRFYTFYLDNSNPSRDPTTAGGVARFKEYPISTTLSQGMNVYMKVEKITSGTMMGYAKLTVMNASDFSQVYADLYYYMGNRWLASNGVINRQITLCNQSGNFTNGTKMNNAIFWNSWLYASSGYNAAPNSTNTEQNNRGAFTEANNGGPSTGIVDVTVNWYAPWNEESVTIEF